MNYYVRAKGAYRELPKAKRWTKIRNMEVNGKRIVIEIIHNGDTKYLSLIGSHQANLEFAKGNFPDIETCSWHEIKGELGYV